MKFVLFRITQHSFRQLKWIWISDTVLSNFRCHANLADTAANLVHNTKKLFNVTLYY